MNDNVCASCHMDGKRFKRIHCVNVLGTTLDPTNCAGMIT